MVLRKRVPPHLHSLSQGNAHIDSRSPISPTSPTAKSTSSASPKRLTRPRRARSSPHPDRVPSQDSIYSPDLNTSPAFDLMPLEQAQKSPVGTASSETPNPWDDELVEKPGETQQEYTSLEQVSVPVNYPQEWTTVDGKKGDRVPSILVAGTQRRMATNEWQSVNNAPDWEHLGQSQVQLRSNNPFLKTKQLEQNPWEYNYLKAPNGEEDASDRLSQSEGYIPMTARLSLFDQPASESPWSEDQPNSGLQSPTLQNGQNSSQPAASFDQFAQGNGLAVPYETSASTYGRHGYTSENGINTPSGTGSTANTTSSHELIEFDEAPKSNLETVLPLEVSPVYGRTTNGTHEPQGLPPPPLPPPRNASEPSAGPSSGQLLTQPRPSVPISEAEAKRQIEQRSETYSIRHVNWTDITGKLRRSPVLIQNKNGPCPLLALVNALVLRAGEDKQPPIVKALETREQISLGLLIEALFDELTTCLGPDDELPDIEALSRFLTMLHTGMNVNPRLTLESNEEVGTFLNTGDLHLYGTFGVPLVHGWLAAPSAEADAALKRVAQYHEDIQLLPFRRQELEDRVLRGGSLTSEEEQVMKDIQAIQRFIDIENATQLSTFGLDHLTEKLPPGSFSILFRNDHFSTLYKHPQMHQLFTLVTDAGFSTHEEVVWECLVDVNGSNAEFFAGDFRPVGNAQPGPSDPSDPRTSSGGTSLPAAPSESRTSALSSQEQADADYAYALSLQYQEEERQQREGNNRRASVPSHASGNSRPPNTVHNRSASAVNGNGSRYPAENRSRQSQYSGRYPPSRPANAQSAGNDPNNVPPPSYEQAARSPAYSPRPASPSQDPRYQRNQYGRHPQSAPIATGPADRSKDRNKDCVIM